MIYGMEIFPAPVIIQYHSKQYPKIFFIDETAVIETVIFPIEQHPVVFIQSFRVIKVVDHTVRDTAIVGELILVNPEFNDSIITRIAAHEIQAIDNNIVATDFDH